MNLSKLKCAICLSTAFLFPSVPCQAMAFLESGLDVLLWAPEANFERELKRLKPGLAPFTFAESSSSYSEESARADRADLAGALRNRPEGEREQIIEDYEAERIKLAEYREKKQYSFSSEPEFPLVHFPLGLPLEFRLYLEGTEAFHAGSGALARAKWQELLSLPRGERKFRSTWAAYMMGKSWLKEDDAKASQHFELVRSLARSGYRDSLGLAASSYGWQARAELNQGRYLKALEGYFDAYRADDPAAALSLRLVISEILGREPAALEKLAEHEILRKIVTAHLISGFAGWSDIENAGESKNRGDKGTLWVGNLVFQKVKDPFLFEQLALGAYRMEQWGLARNYVERIRKSSVLAQWLEAKLLMREGKTIPAIAILSRLSAQVPQNRQEQSDPITLIDNVRINRGWGDYSVSRHIEGELALLQMSAREYTGALQALIESDFMEDAAFIAERVLTLDEFQNFVDSSFPRQLDLPEAELDSDQARLYRSTERIRSLLGYRLARESQFEAARIYLDERGLEFLGSFLPLWSQAHNTSEPAGNRAQAFWSAAQRVKQNGLDLFGQPIDEVVRYPELSSEDERKRVASSKPARHPSFHIHYLAADLAWEAAKLMPDNNDETARVLHAAGSWLKNQDGEVADRFYKALVRRCRRTELGHAADIKRWFPRLDDNGQIIYPLRQNNAEQAVYREPFVLQETQPVQEVSLETE